MKLAKKRTQMAFKAFGGYLSTLLGRRRDFRAARNDFRARGVIPAANESVFSDGDLIPALNQVEIGVNGELICPFGDFPIVVQISGKPTRVMQRVNRQAADLMISAFNSARGRLARAFVGYPVYVGHPDMPGWKPAGNEKPDTRAYGWIEGITCDDTQVTFAVNWSKPGRDLVDNKHYRFHSEYWGLMPIDGANDGMPLYMPALLYSAGLTNTPNIPVPAVNEQPTEGNATMNLLQRIIALLGLDAGTDEDNAIGKIQSLFDAAKKISDAVDARWKAEDAARVAVANEAPAIDRGLALFADQEKQLQAANEKITTLESEKGGLTDQLAAANEKAAGLETEKTTALTAAANEKTAQETLQTQLADLTRKNGDLVVAAANERAERAKLIVDAGIRDGKLLLGDRDTWLQKFGAEFDASLLAVGNARPFMKLRPQVENVATRAMADVSPADQFIQAVNERMAEKHENWETAWTACMKSHAALYDQMAKPKQDFNGARAS